MDNNKYAAFDFLLVDKTPHVHSKRQQMLQLYSIYTLLFI